MPFINTKYSQDITPAQEEQIKSALGEAVKIIGKTESWLMVGFPGREAGKDRFRGGESIRHGESCGLRQNDCGDMPYLRRGTGRACGQYVRQVFPNRSVGLERR